MVKIFKYIILLITFALLIIATVLVTGIEFGNSSKISVMLYTICVLQIGGMIKSAIKTIEESEN